MSKASKRAGSSDEEEISQRVARVNVRGQAQAEALDVKPRVLKHEEKVKKKKSTEGTKTVAKGADSLAALRALIKKMPAGSKERNDMMTALNALTKEYDNVIVAYVGKRKGLVEANKLLEQVQEQLEKAGQTEAELRKEIKKLTGMRSGCGCGKGTKTSVAGRCFGCGCAKAGMDCTDKCGCGIYCSRPGNKSDVAEADKALEARYRKIIQKRRAEENRQAPRASAAAADPSDDEEEERGSSVVNSSENESEYEEGGDSDYEEGEEGRSTPQSPIDL